MPAFDEFTTVYRPSLVDPADRAETVTPSDDDDLQFISRAICVSGSGMVRLTTKAGDTVDIYMVQGATFPIRATRIWETGTSATGIVSLS